MTGHINNVYIYRESSVQKIKEKLFDGNTISVAFRQLCTDLHETAAWISSFVSDTVVADYTYLGHFFTFFVS